MQITAWGASLRPQVPVGCDICVSVERVPLDELQTPLYCLPENAYVGSVERLLRRFTVMVDLWNQEKTTRLQSYRTLARQVWGQ